jgi:hypothetical protein
MRNFVSVALLLALFPLISRADGTQTYSATSTVISYSASSSGPITASGETQWTFTGPMDFTVIDVGFIDPSLTGSSTEWVFDGGGITNISAGDTPLNLSYISQCAVADVEDGMCELSRLISRITFFEMPPRLAGTSEIESWKVTIGAPTDGQFTFTLLGTTATPEPSTLLLIATGLPGIVWFKLRRRIA